MEILLIILAAAGAIGVALAARGGKKELPAPVVAPVPIKDVPTPNPVTWDHPNVGDVLLTPPDPVVVAAPVAMPSHPFSGSRVQGAVSTYWAQSGPGESVLISNPANHATIPPEGWAAIQKYFEPWDWESAVNIAFLESSFTLHNPNLGTADVPEMSYGPFQVNRNAWPQYTVGELETWDGNVAAARHIKDVQGWGAWYHSATALGLI